MTTSMVPAVPFPLLALDRGVVVDANRHAVALLGGDDAAVLGRDLVDLVDPADVEAVRSLLAGADEEEVARVHLLVGGRRRAVELRVGGAGAPGDRSCALVSMVDRGEEELLHGILDVAADGSFLLDATGLVRWLSHGLRRQIPAGVGSGVGVNPFDLVHPEDLPGILETAAQGLEAPGNRIRHVARARSLTRGPGWWPVEIVGVNALAAPDVGGFLIQVRELDDADGADDPSGGRLLSLAEAAPMGIVVSDLVDRTVYRNGIARRLLGHGVANADQDWRAVARPDARARLSELVAEVAVAGESRDGTFPFEVDGATRWLRVHVVPRLSGSSGEGSYVIAALEDVTAELEAREATDRLTHMLDATSDYVAVFRPTGEILYVNAATRGLLDRLADEGGSGALRDLIDDEPRRAWIEAAMAELEDADVWQGNLELNAGGGRRIPVSALGVIHRGDDGELDWVAIHARDISDLKEAEHRLRELASHDHLTGLANRARFNERLEQAVARHRRDHRGLAVLFCDLDGFKAINDRHGHAAGDVVLTVIADRLRLVTRTADTIARVGGDEFVIVCEGVADDDGLGLLARRVIEAVTGPITLPEVARTAQPPERIRVGISVGVGVAGPDHPEVDPDRLLTLADSAMYEAKAAGGSGVVIARLT